MNDKAKFRLNEINKIKDYFNSKVQEIKIISRKLSKYIRAFDYFDNTLLVLSAASGGVSIISFASVIGVPAGIGSASFTLNRNNKRKLLKITRNKKKNHNKIVVLAESKLNSIKTLISQALIDLEIGHEEFETIVKEKEKYEKIK